MAVYFPMFIDFRGRNITVIGAFEKAEDKIKKLSLFGAEIVSVDSPIDDPHELIREAPAAVIVSDSSLVDVSRLYTECVASRIPINTVDDADHSTFIFPSMISKGSLTLAVSTDGACPAAAVKIRRDAEELIPSEIDAILDYLSEMRRLIRNKGSAEERRLIIRELTERCFAENRPLSHDESCLALCKYGF